MTYGYIGKDDRPPIGKPKKDFAEFQKAAEKLPMLKSVNKKDVPWTFTKKGEQLKAFKTRVYEK